MQEKCETTIMSAPGALQKVFYILPVQLCNELRLDSLRAYCLAFVVVAAVAEALFEHGLSHNTDAADCFDPALGKRCEV